MFRVKRIIAGASVAAFIAAGAGLATGAVRIDRPLQTGAYGVSIGTDTSYCYADLVPWRFGAGCETAR